ncbi:hypothetical protein [Polaromonas sp.]|uniref:5-methylcytosine restriction system specificity protein McrC n=1 Tax=Polaromonas sp. TaxID=1869339 RepID=UPI003455681B
MKPDILASKAGQIAFIVDTKWKRLKEQGYREGVTSTDVYQMYAYSTQYASPEVLLLYPHHSELGEWRPRRAEYWVNGVDGVDGVDCELSLNQRVCVSTIDLRDLNSVPGQLKSMFPTNGISRARGEVAADAAHIDLTLELESNINPHST